MTSRDFCYWLQGLFELSEPRQLSVEQTTMVRRHLALVFEHEIDPSAGPPEKQAELSAIHEGLSESDVVEIVEKTLAKQPKPFNPNKPRRC